MRFITTLVIGTALALPAMAQTAHTTTKPHHTMRHSSHMTARETVNDKGPFTPEANRAYNGGGMVTDSAPGGMPGSMPGSMPPTSGQQPMAPMR